MSKVDCGHVDAVKKIRSEALGKPSTKLLLPCVSDPTMALQLEIFEASNLNARGLISLL
jgi:hypothetical protein